MLETKRKWHDLSTTEQAVISGLSIVQMVLLIGALVDILRRPADSIRGNRWIWVAVSFINFVGPITYFLVGRKQAGTTEE